jgi:glycosyltransferase involved in cell wall biosynthesis
MSEIYLVTSHYEKNEYTGAKRRRHGFLNARTRHKVIELAPRDGSFRYFICFVTSLLKLQIRLFIHSDIIVISEGLIPIFNFKTCNKTFFLIHDFKNSTSFARKRKFLRTLYYSLMTRIHNAILTVSYSEKVRLLRSFSDTNIVVSYNGVSEDFLVNAEFCETKCFDFIYVSNFTKHKNHKFLLAEGFKGKSICLVGTNMDLDLDEYNHYLEKFTVFSDVSQGELISLYSRSKALIFPSLLEGFGMPVVEAACLDLAIYTSDLEVFRELLMLTGGKIIDIGQGGSLNVLKDYPQTVSKEFFSWDSIVEKIVEDAFT